MRTFLISGFVCSRLLGKALLAASGLTVFQIQSALAETQVLAWGTWDGSIRGPWEFLRNSETGENVTNVKSIVATGYAVLASFNDGKFVEFTPNDESGGYRARTRFGLTQVRAAAGSFYNHIAVKQDGTVVTWQVFGFEKGPVPAGLSGVKSVAATDDYFAALKENGTVVVWSSDPDDTGLEPAPPAGLANVKAIAAGFGAMYALKTDGGVVAWESSAGFLDEDHPMVPPQAARSGVAAIAAGDTHVLALKEDGTVVGWGRYWQGGGWNGIFEVPTSARTNAIAVSAHGETGMVLKSDGSVIVWPATHIAAKKLPVGLAGVQSIALGYDFAAALVDTTHLVPDLKVFELTFDGDDDEVPIKLEDGISSVSFGNVGVGSWQSLPIRIQNSGFGELKNVSISVTGENASDFEIDDAPPATLRAGDSEVFEVFFSPKARGSLKATLNITSNNPNDGSFAINLFGSGIDVPQIAVRSEGLRLENENSELSFGVVARGESKVLKLSIKNEGNLKLEDISVRIAGDDEDDFAMVEAPEDSLKPGASTTLELLFSPESSGMKHAEVRIKSNDRDDNPFVVYLSGKRGRAPEIAVYNHKRLLSGGNSNVSFGTVRVGESKTRTLTITNQGNAVLTDIKAGLVGGMASEFTLIEGPAKFCAPGQTTLVKVRYSPSRSSAHQATLRISSNDKDEKSFDVRLSGAGGVK